MFDAKCYNLSIRLKTLFSLHYISVNGEIASSSDYVISHQDRGLLLGDGFFTTLKYTQNLLIYFEAHYQRLCESAQTFLINFPYAQKDLQTFINDLINANKCNNSDLAIRITVTRGPGNRGLGFELNSTPTLLITLSNLPIYSQSLRCMISDFKRSSISPLCNIKHLGYQTNVLAYHQATQGGFDDAILVNENNCVVCTSRANIFFIKNNHIITPPLQDGCLPGVMRKNLLKDFPQVHCASIPKNSLSNFEAAFVTNSLCSMIPISQINQQNMNAEHSLIKLVAQFLGAHHNAQSYQ